MPYVCLACAMLVPFVPNFCLACGREGDEGFHTALVVAYNETKPRWGGAGTNIRTYLHAYMPTYSHTSTLTYLHTHVLYLHIYILTYLHTCIPTHLHTCILLLKAAVGDGAGTHVLIYEEDGLHAVEELELAGM